MTQISKHHLDKNIESRMFVLFWRSLTRLGSQTETADFFGDLLTYTEKIMLAKRYFIAVLLAKGHSATNIRQALHVSFTNIGSVAAWLKNLRPATKKIIDKHLKDEAWGQFFDKIDSFLDSLPPFTAYPHQKPAIYKQRFQADRERSDRKTLR